jgi:osmotically-inducible protein OsmY
MHKSFLSLFVIPIPVYSLACALVLIGALSGCATDQSSGGRMTDEKITAAVQARLDGLADLGPPHSITVQTRNHIVYLNGQVDTGLEKRMAESVTMKIPGVTSVENGIDVNHN